MQQVLRNHDRLPENTNDRAALFTSLYDLSNELSDEESVRIQDWLRDGGAFPQPIRAQVTGAEEETGAIHNGIDEDEYLLHEDYEYGGSVEYSDGDEGMSDIDEEEDMNERESSADLSDGNVPHVPENSPEVVRARPRRTMPEEQLTDPENPDTAGWYPPAIAAPEVPDGKVECTICCNQYDAEDFPDKITPACNHRYRQTICISCLRSFIEERLDNGSIVITCPFCSLAISPEQIKAFATPELYARYLNPPFSSVP